MKLLDDRSVASFQRKIRWSAGIGKEELREQCESFRRSFRCLLDMLVQEKKLEDLGRSSVLPGRGVVMKDEEADPRKSLRLHSRRLDSKCRR